VEDSVTMNERSSSSLLLAAGSCTVAWLPNQCVVVVRFIWSHGRRSGVCPQWKNHIGIMNRPALLVITVRQFLYEPWTNPSKRKVLYEEISPSGWVCSVYPYAGERVLQLVVYAINFTV